MSAFDDAPISFSQRGPSPLGRLLICVALALFLMVADARLGIVQPLRATLATVLYPAQWLALQPVQWVKNGYSYMTELKTAQKAGEAALMRLVEQSRRAGQVEQLLQENERLRKLLALRERASTPAMAAQVLYDATDPYTRRVIIDKGSVQGIQPGSPVLDEAGVLGQVTRVYPFVSEITLLIDRDQAIPVLNTRTGVRSVAYGDPTPRSGLMELRYTFASEDVREGDLLATSGIDGVYPPGLPVARVRAVQRQSELAFMRVECEPLAATGGVTHVMVLQPVQYEQDRPDTAAASPARPDTKPAHSAAGAGAAP